MEEITLRTKQIQTLERMLHLNKEGSTDLTLATKNEEIIWKALVMDQKGQSIISSVLRVNDLLRCGITIHQLINLNNRSELPDITVIYFIEPTIENILIIIEDLKNDKYDEFYINFISNINRELLEEFAKQVSIIGKNYKIKQIFDQYLDYIVTEPNLFLLNLSKIFTIFNNPKTTEDEINKYANILSNSLLSLILTTGDIPIIRCQRNGPAEFIATQLDLKLRDYLLNSKNQISNSNNSNSGGNSDSIKKRSVLIIVDRNIDLSSMFNHSWIYQCMINDVFNLKRNTIKIPDLNKVYDIDPKDFFWLKNSQLPFPDVIENVNLELEIYKKEAGDLTNKTGVSSLNDINLDSNNGSGGDNDTAKIQQAIDLLPELTARKSTLDMHMDVLSSLIKEIEKKSLDKFFEIEQNLNNSNIQQDFIKLLESESDNNNITDKLRSFIILYLYSSSPNSNLNLTSDYIDQIKSIFLKLDPNIDLSCLTYIEKFKTISRLANYDDIPVQNQNQSNNNNESNYSDNSVLLSNLSSRIYGLTEGRISEGISSLTSGLKKILPTKSQLPLTNIVESIMTPESSSKNSIKLTDDYLYLDPKLRGGHLKPPKRQNYNDSIVFVVGGGNYLEYQNLQELKNSNIKNIVYGSSDILTANEFLTECNYLGGLE